MQIVNDKYVLDDLEVLIKDIGYGLDSNKKSLIFEFILVFSKSFQRFAVRTSKQMDEISNLGEYNISLSLCCTFEYLLCLN